MATYELIDQFKELINWSLGKTSSEYKFRRKDMKKGILTVPEKFTGIKYPGINGIKNLREIHFLGNIDCASRFSIEENPNLTKVVYKGGLSDRNIGYAECYSLSEIVYGTESHKVKMASCGIGGIIKNSEIRAPYTIYDVESPALGYTCNEGQRYVIAEITIDGYQYAGIMILGYDNNKPMSEYVNGAINKIRHRIAKHIAPGLYFNDGFYGTESQKELLDDVVDNLLQRASVGTGKAAFNADICDGNNPKTNPHNLDADILEKLQSPVCVKVIWANSLQYDNGR